jgi:Outer membrane receptor proteins, mostly Fe transport
MKIPRLALIFAFFFLPAIIFARDIELTVEDEDLAMPLEGATVVLRSGRKFICNEKGKALVTLPDDKPAIISITYPGYETFRLSIPGADAAKSGQIEKFTAAMRLGGIMQGQELVLEAARPETSETRSGRSVAISDRELTRTAEIGIVEDVMNSVKLLPGVGYTGMFSAMPSIRGGDPGDLMAVLDGFYVERPYYWMGSISIFDPKMVSSARLSHGVFSARYGHTISGLLEITSKSPSSTETEIEAAIGTSATSLNLSVPLSGKGGILFMGKVTYWDTLIWAAQGLSHVTENETLNAVNSISTAPYIRSAALSMNYRFTPDFEWRLNAFFGSDGVGADFKTDYTSNTDDSVEGVMEMKADYNNYQGFIITGFSASPAPKVALRFSGGIGILETITEDYVDNRITAAFNDDFLNLFSNVPQTIINRFGLVQGNKYSAPNVNAVIDMENTIFNAQSRFDADVDLGKGFIVAGGVQELYSLWMLREDISLGFTEIRLFDKDGNNNLKNYKGDLPQDIEYYYLFLNSNNMNIPYLAIVIPRNGYNSNVRNQGFTTSAYGLIEYKTPNQRFGTELGLRVDHLYFKGKNFEFQTMPALNPRFNIDFGIIKNRGVIESLTVTAGTGLFSSINPLFCFFDPGNFEIGDSVDDLEVKFNRAWTSVIGTKIDFAQKYSINIEGYYKHVYDRGYITVDMLDITPSFHFDGIGEVWGFDVQLQKLESRYWDGWISYTYTWAKYRDPSSGANTGTGVVLSNNNLGDIWYYPSFHRFHNFNLVLNIKPLLWFNIALRFGFASGQPRRKVDDKIYPYPVIILDENNNPAIIQKYRRSSWYDDNERTPWSFPLDIKFSFFPVNKNGRASMEIYAAGENMMSLFYSPPGRTTFNQYTGKEDQGGSSGSFDLPIPMVSFGVKWRY